MIETATRLLEDYCSMKFVSQQWDIFFDNWPCSKNSKWWDGVKDGPISMLTTYEKFISLPMGKIISLDQFSTYDDNNTEYAESVSNYVIDTASKQGRVSLKYSSVWPTTLLRQTSGIRMRATLGFGIASEVPSNIKLAVMEYAAFLYENRGDEMRSIPPSITNLVNEWRDFKIG
jgi:hypothetical protein